MIYIKILFDSLDSGYFDVLLDTRISRLRRDSEDCAALDSRMTRKKRTVIPENAKHLSGIQRIYFWIPDIVAQRRNNSGMTKLLAQRFRNDGEKRTVIPENAKHLSGIQGIYFWIPDIVAQRRNNSGMTKLLAQRFRNDVASRATIPE